MLIANLVVISDYQYLNDNVDRLMISFLHYLHAAV